MGAVEEVFGRKYDSFFNDRDLNKDDEKQSGERMSKNMSNEQDSSKTRSITGIAWNKER